MCCMISLVTRWQPLLRLESVKVFCQPIFVEQYQVEMVVRLIVTSFAETDDNVSASAGSLEKPSHRRCLINHGLLSARYEYTVDTCSCLLGNLGGVQLTVLLSSSYLFMWVYVAYKIDLLSRSKTVQGDTSEVLL